MAVEWLRAGAPSFLCRSMVGFRDAGTRAVRISELATGRAMNPRRRRGLLPTLLLLIFFLPLLVAFLIYYGSNWRPAGHTNHGELIEPARPLPRIALPQTNAPG